MNYYSVIRYVPNPLNEEFINIGVYAFNEKEIKVKFLENWDRVRAFSNEDIGFLLQFKDSVYDVVQNGSFIPGDDPKKGNNLFRLQKISNSWMNSIQFREPLASLIPLEYTLDECDWLVEL